MLKASWGRAIARSSLFATAFASAVAAQTPLRMTSPDGRNVVTVEAGEGRLAYAVQRDRRAVLTASRLGFEFRGAPALRDSLRITGHAERSHDET